MTEDREQLKELIIYLMTEQGNCDSEDMENQYETWIKILRKSIYGKEKTNE